MRVLKSILLFYIEKWEFLRILFRKMLYSYVLYWKMMFEVKSYVFLLKNEDWGFLKTLSEKILHSYVLYWEMMFLKLILLFCIEKWGFPKSLSWKNSILMYFIEKWCFRSQFFCFVLKNEEWEFLKTLSEKMLHSYALFWKMRFLRLLIILILP